MSLMNRAFYTAVKIAGFTAPYDTLHVKVYYPAKLSGSDFERNTGIVPADSARAPFPVVIFLPGVNCGPESYSWLAESLVSRGWVFVTFTWISETLPGVIGQTPGVDLKMLRPETYGSGPTASALPTLLTEIERIHTTATPLQGLLDLQHIVLGGHSAGGTIALQNADPRYFPQVQRAFAYGAHSMAATMLGFAPGTILPLPPRPLLLLGGTHDGVIAASSARYGGDHAPDPIARTFCEAATHGALVLFEGANHFSFTHPHDTTLGRAFLEAPAAQSEDDLRTLMAQIIADFLAGKAAIAPHPLIAVIEHKP